MLYAPNSNIGALNFDKSSGYITIPDNQVVYTRTAEQPEGRGNEGQQMVWQMQDLHEGGLEQEIAAPQLLAGINIEEKR